MSWVSVYIHMVFTTKNRYPYLNTPELRKNVFQHIKNNAKAKDIWLDNLSGYDDHAHCLIALGKEQNISQIAQLIKGESSFWINKNQLTTEKFAWQDDYWAVGVSESHLARVRNYIQNQETHHSKETFSVEINRFSRKYQWSLIKDE